MSNALMTLDVSQLPSTQIGSDDVFNDLAKGGDFLGRLQLFTKGKAIDRGLIKPGHYGIPESAEEIEDLSDTIDVIPFARKPKAIDMSDKEAIIVSHDPTSELFQRISETAKEKESNCMFGPSFLVFERTSGRFLEFFCGSKSTRAEAKKIYPFLPLSQSDIDRKVAEGDADMAGVEPHGPLPLTLKSRLVEGKFSWHVPVVVKCSTPFSNLPKMEVISREITKFITAKAEEVTRVDDGGKKSRAR